MQEMRNTNKVFGETLTALGEENPRLVVIEADLTKASGSLPFREKFPERHLNVGIAEQNLVSFAAGLAADGLVPVVTTFACFAAQRACDQAVNSVAYNGYDIKIIGTAAGLTNEKNGGTHISVDDVSIFRTIPHFTVIDPADAVEFATAVRYAVTHAGPFYIRSNRGDYPVFHDESYAFIPGRGEVLRRGTDIGILASGITTWEALLAAKRLAEEGIEAYVVNMPSIKPFDKASALACARSVSAMLTVENHSVYGGLGSAAAETLAEAGVNCRLVRLGLQDCFGETATRAYQMHKKGIDADGIVRAAREALHRA